MVPDEATMLHELWSSDLDAEAVARELIREVPEQVAHPGAVWTHLAGHTRRPDSCGAEVGQ